MRELQVHTAFREDINYCVTGVSGNAMREVVTKVVIYFDIKKAGERTSSYYVKIETQDKQSFLLEEFKQYLNTYYPGISKMLKEFPRAETELWAKYNDALGY